MKIEGTLVTWFEPRGFGWVHENRGGKLFSYFLHISKVLGGNPRVGATVRFNPDQTLKGPVALDAEIFSTDATDVLAGKTPAEGE